MPMQEEVSPLWLRGSRKRSQLRELLDLFRLLFSGGSFAASCQFTLAYQYSGKALKRGSLPPGRSLKLSLFTVPSFLVLSYEKII